MLDDTMTKEVVARLNRIEGQVAGIRRMVQSESYCVDMLNQISAVHAAVAKVGGLILAGHVDTCVTESLDSDSDRERRQKIEAIVEIFHRYGGVVSK